MTELQNDQKTGDKSPEGFDCHNFRFGMMKMAKSIKKCVKSA
jgi:hypothetical protein